MSRMLKATKRSTRCCFIVLRSLGGGEAPPLLMTTGSMPGAAGVSSGADVGAACDAEVARCSVSSFFGGAGGGRLKVRGGRDGTETVAAGVTRERPRLGNSAGSSCEVCWQLSTRAAAARRVVPAELLGGRLVLGVLFSGLLNRPSSMAGVAKAPRAKGCAPPCAGRSRRRWIVERMAFQMVSKLC